MRRIFVLVVVLIGTALRLLAQTEAPAGERPVVFLRIDGPIGPATARFLADGLEKAQVQDAAALVVELDTPGGLETSMREMVRDILASPVPIIAHVTPRGARAASAGTFLVYASHVAAMATATNLGAATPVAIGPGPEAFGGDARDPGKDKAINDAAAMIRGLAELRGRDPVFAEAAVREAASLSASEALARGVIEIIADSRQELLDALDGRVVSGAGGEQILAVARAPIVDVQPSWPTQILSVLANPNIAYLLLMLGFYGVLYELASPGSVFPGVAGTIALVLALFSLHVLPVSFAGASLLLLGVALMLAEALSPSFGAFGVGGVVAFIVGSLLLIDVESPGFALSRPLIAGVAVVSAAFFIGVLRLGLRARRRPVVSGREQMIGSIAVAATSFDEHGDVHVHGEVWNADTEAPLAEGQAAQVIDVAGLRLRVRPVPESARGVP